MNTRSKQCLSFKDIINKDNNDDKKIQSQETRSKKRKYTNIDINLSLNKQNNKQMIIPSFSLSSSRICVLTNLKMPPHLKAASLIASQEYPNQFKFKHTSPNKTNKMKKKTKTIRNSTKELINDINEKIECKKEEKEEDQEEEKELELEIESSSKSDSDDSDYDDDDNNNNNNNNNSEEEEETSEDSVDEEENIEEEDIELEKEEEQKDEIENQITINKIETKESLLTLTPNKHFKKGKRRNKQIRNQNTIISNRGMLKIENLVVGEYLSRLEYLKVIDIDIDGSRDNVNQRPSFTVEKVRMNQNSSEDHDNNNNNPMIPEQWKVESKAFEMNSSQQFFHNLVLNKTELAEKFIHCTTGLFTVCFRCVLNQKHVNKVLEQHLKEKLKPSIITYNNTKNNSHSSFTSRKIKEITRQVLEGRNRILIGRMIKPNTALGFSLVDDLEQSSSNWNSNSFNNCLKQVNHRDLLWFIYAGVKYELGKSNRNNKNLNINIKN